MADLIIKPATGDGNKLILQDKAGGAVLTTNDTGIIFHTSSSAPGSPTAGQFYYNSTNKVAYVYDGASWRALNEAIAAGGTNDTYSTYGSYKVHTYLTSGTFTPSVAGEIDILLIAGGGGGGHSQHGHQAGGGGAGGYIYMQNVSVTPRAYTVGVGGGGAGGTSSYARGVNGGNSYFGFAPENADIKAKGGGGGGAGGNNGTNRAGNAGGSGGGAGSSDATRSVYDDGGRPTAGQGSMGGAAIVLGSGAGGSGGGAGSPGGTSSAGGSNVAGGIGFMNTIRAGTGVMYAAGGKTIGTANASVNTGDGGGGGYSGSTASGRNGGSGIVIIRFAI